ncbi:MAG: response regulator [Chloroflexia bacterium]
MKSILVIEDNAVLADFIAEVLQEEGYDVELAANGQEGLQKLPEVHPDLVITDLMMPKLSGEEVCKVIHADPEFRSIPVVLMTSRVDESLKVKCKYDAFLPKPFDLYHLLGLVVRLIGVTI